MSAASELRGRAAIAAMTVLMNARRGTREIREIAQESALYADELVSALYPNAPSQDINASALAAANEIADQFTKQFINDQQIGHFAQIIEKHFTAVAKGGAS